MGSYLLIPKKTPNRILKLWFKKYKPFFNDFGQEHKFEDIFGDETIIPKGYIRFKYGVQQADKFKSFYSEKAEKEIREIKGVIEEK
jgi:hypothetical protein